MANTLTVYRFEGKPSCEKCGENEPEYKYGHYTNNLAEAMGGTGAEALRLTCRRCGFVWFMRIKEA